MRVNRYLAYRYGASRRQADKAIANGEVYVNGELAKVGQILSFPEDTVLWVGHMPIEKVKFTTIKLNKPVGYVCSSDGQGSPTVYDLLPPSHKQLKIAGRLDKDSSGLVLLSDDGQLIHNLTHPSNNKTKQYLVGLDKILSKKHVNDLILGVDIGDETPSRFMIEITAEPQTYLISIEEGRNRQIRRSFSVIGYNVVELHRIGIDTHKLDDIKPGQFIYLD